MPAILAGAEPITSVDDRTRYQYARYVAGPRVDSAGSVYVAGYTYSLDFPTKNPYASAPPAKVAGVSPGQWPSAFVTKFSPDGSSLVYSTYLGGNGYDYIYAIAWTPVAMPT